MKKFLFLTVCLLIVSAGLAQSQAQSRLIFGSVLHAEDDNPIAGASIIVKNTSVGVTSGADGGFTINVPASSTILQVSFVGTKTVEVEAIDNMVVRLYDDTEELGQVVVTALGISREKKALGYAVQEVKSEDLTQGANSNFVTALQGKVAGVDIISSSGMPGASSKITIRGARSFTENNTPLYVVDGLPIASTSDISTENSVTGSDYASRSLDIDPNDIESVNILKGQAASALYGMRASNGVVVIVTKSGKNAKKDKATVTFNSNVSFDLVSILPNFQKEFAQGAEGKFDPTASTSWGPKISGLPDDPTYGGNANGHPGLYQVPQRTKAGLDPWVTPKSYNNAKEFFETGFTFNNSVNVAKGLSKGHYSFSLGSANATGIVPSTGMNRYNAKINTEIQLSEHWKTGFSGNFVDTKLSKQTGANNGIVATVYGAPPSYDFAGIPYHVKDDPYNQNTFRGTGGFDGAYWAVENNSFTEETQRFFGNSFINYETSFSDKDKLNLKYQLGIDSYVTNYEDLWGYGHSNGKGGIDNYAITKKELNSLLTAVYNWNINDDLTLDLLYGNEIIEYKRNWVNAIGRNFNFSGWNHINNVAVYQASFSMTRRRTIGNFGNMSLGYKNMLYLNVSVRNDIISSMPANSRSFTYPSVSLGWVFTELDNLRNDILTFGKLRTSYAEVGQAGNYTETYYRTPEYGGGFSSGTPIMYPVQGITAYSLYSSVYDPNLKPQNTKSYEFGADFSFFSGILSLNYTFSRQNVVDQIFSVPVAGSSGAQYYITNGGSVHTNAHELILGVKPFDNKSFKWDFSFNFSKIDNYVDKLAEGVESIFLGGFVEPQVRAGVGYKFPVIFGVGYLRNADGKIVVDENGFPQPGEEQVLGDVSPDFRLGFNTNIELYKFRISAVLDWKQGGVIYSATPGMLDFYGVTQTSADYRKKDSFIFNGDAVKETGVDAAGNPTYVPNDITVSGISAEDYFNTLSNISESMVVENSFIKLREIALSYPVWNKNDFSVSLNAFARNLILWSTLKGIDPEASQGNTNMAGAFEHFSLPGTTSYGFGINIKF
ncbi:MAG: SusC/RagA family TonB-linked outer membrane protein [Prevotellaceae bacterium]|jgi:TonB-linked SusC/RagA family outer membrane protein|nr:SusC/RagA family TonB-linked outer membrane protein [Prevotellaceae bacterium]